ncbi:MAG: hypothetical protein O7E57_08110 [Gammaproteobacteria bacterium]|nr:hypothetical protein [Gammaproteobacteria bacterium]
MKSVVRLFALGAALVSGSVFANNPIDNHGVLRVHIPVHVHGPERIKLARLISRHRRIDLDNYVLLAVVVHGSHGHTRLTIGRYSSPTVHLNHQKVRIAAPARYGDHWYLYLSPDTELSAVTAILEPRPRHAHRGYIGPGFNLGWLWRNDYNHHEYRSNRTRVDFYKPIKTTAPREPHGKNPARHREPRTQASYGVKRDRLNARAESRPLYRREFSNARQTAS